MGNASKRSQAGSGWDSDSCQQPSDCLDSDSAATPARDSSAPAPMHFATALLHADDDAPAGPTGSTPAIYQTSTYVHPSAERHAAVAGGRAPGYSYTRCANPTVGAFERRVCALEGGIDAIATSSGLAAVFNAVMNILRAGDTILACARLYGGSVELFVELEAFGVQVRYLPEFTPEALAAAVDDTVRVLFAETIANPLLEVLDIPAVAAFAHERGIAFIVDNTVATPYLCRPLELGADVVVESSSKYLNGHGTAISGVVVTGKNARLDPERYPGLKPFQKFGPMAYSVKLRQGLYRNTGACLSPENAFLNCVGMETLALRMERACANALALAEWFERSGLVDDVRYPGLASNPFHELAARQFGGLGYGALVTIRVGSKERAFNVIDRLRYPLIVSNIGDTKTLVAHAATTIFADNTEEERLAAGVYQDTIRISVGIEDIRDLIADFAQALDQPSMGQGT